MAKSGRWFTQVLAIVGFVAGWGLAARADQGQGRVTITGLLTIVRGDDFVNGKTDVLYEIEQRQEDVLPGQARRAFRIDFKGAEPPPGLQTGSLVSAHGSIAIQKRCNRGTNECQCTGELALDPNGLQTSSSTSGTVAAVSGIQRTIVILCNFNDRLLDPNATITNVSNLLFTSGSGIDAYYRFNSEGALSFTGDVHGPYTIPYSYTTTTYSAWSTAAQQQAQAAGVSFTGYTRKIFVFPVNATGYGGLGSIGGSPSTSWIFYWNSASLYSHEMGHNLGLHHASTPTSEYGDASSVMGNGYAGLNAPQKFALGWIPAGQVVQPSTQTYRVVAVAQSSAETKALKVGIPGTSESFWISYRNRAGFDNNLNTTFASRTSIHRWTNVGSAKTFLQGTIGDGQSWGDPTTGLTVTQLANDGIAATLQISLVVVPVAPTVTVTPSSQAAPSGTARVYSVSVRNQDSANAPASMFSVTPTAPSGWTAVASPAQVSVAPGATGTVQVSITAAPGADASHTIAIGVSDAAEPLHSRSASATFVLDGTAPGAPANLAGTGARRSVTLTWSASSDGAGSGVGNYVVWKNGAEVGQTSGTTFTSSTGGSFELQAVDRAGNRSLKTAPVVVNTTSGGGGGGAGGGKGKP